MDRDSDMSETGLWIFFKSPLYFTYTRLYWTQGGLISIGGYVEIKHKLPKLSLSTHLTGQSISILQSLVNLTLFQVILRPLSFQLLVKFLLVFQLLKGGNMTGVRDQSIQE